MALLSSELGSTKGTTGGLTMTLPEINTFYKEKKKLKKVKRKQNLT